jgi:DNA repair protein RecO (recombination protein O)
MTYRDRGIILKRRNIGEADRLLVFLSQERGKQAVVAKGVRKIGSKLAGHIEPLNEVGFFLAEGKGLDIVAGAEVAQDFSGISDSLDRYRAASVLLELADKLLADGEPSREAYQLLRESLARLNTGGTAKAVEAFFELRFISLLGYQPELERCLVCRKRVDPDDTLQLMDGGLVHESCEAGRNTLKISAEQIKLLRLMSLGDERFFRITDLVSKAESIAPLAALLRSHVLERGLVSERVIPKEAV